MIEVAANVSVEEKEYRQGECGHDDECHQYDYGCSFFVVSVGF